MGCLCQGGVPAQDKNRVTGTPRADAGNGPSMGRTPPVRTALVGTGHRARILGTARGAGDSLTAARAQPFNPGRVRTVP